ncbi:lipid A ABC transporter ATP-binding protein/permease MsbA [Vibrio coralliirubri]|uniref:lipid A ABC transporter ATP-binding protein/permease MsbA n=1 Tax=Vibrio coralliirubri TaxID=1516159 RepID=UPI00063536FA|nr:lipid A ABC transporter ATP-binding protein/permease MsbA [Vibrio coralliirubri]CDT01598.1 Lipid A export ATP-binding/permease protein msbA [Vibrio coralliirubri]CDT46854.1 Lipid A export ATP-binding/permease protein msbA [Vibrio coralliirubri]CDT72419.1 Lipid A export ATP-binding/permease protein msbA [Vibrio coralliirubri]CDU02565.1 Lipid A export ATP-binding/permease protein msbA [Vibrio coralliirubri]
MSAEKDENTLANFKRLWVYIKEYKSGLVVAVVALVINAISDTYMISLLKPLLDEGFGSADSDFLRTLPIIIFIMMFIRGISGFVSTYCLSWVSGNVVMTIRRKIFNHFMHMPVSFFDKEATGSLLSRITYDSEQVSAATSQALVTIVREGASIIGLLVLMFWNSWQLSLVLFAVAPIVAFGINIVSKRFRTISKNMQTMMGRVTTSAEQMLKGHKVVLTYGGQDVEKERFDKVSNQMRQQNMKLITAQAAANPIIQWIASIAIVIVLVLASVDSIKAELTPGTFTVVFSAMFALMRPLKALTNVTAQFQRGMAASTTLFSLMDLDTEQNKGTLKPRTVTGEVAVKDVTFTYQSAEKPALDKISFEIPKGKTVALVGRSGSGKSTIANLFTRFYDVDSGSIELDGHDIRDYELRNLREHFALVSQNVHLFNDTVANNIAYAAEDKYSREQIEHAAKLAHATEFIEGMENGIDTVVGENGASLSGGQRQRIAIARALLRDAPVLILDEATSALDTESERAIQSALEELQKDKTVLVIAHRLSTIEQADEILVVDDGHIVERGAHAELIAHDGAYAQLHRIQFSG